MYSCIKATDCLQIQFLICIHAKQRRSLKSPELHLCLCLDKDPRLWCEYTEATETHESHVGDPPRVRRPATAVLRPLHSLRICCFWGPEPCSGGTKRACGGLVPHGHGALQPRFPLALLTLVGHKDAESRGKSCWRLLSRSSALLQSFLEVKNILLGCSR